MHDVAKRCAEIAESKGFDRCTWENLLTKLMLVITEIDETCEAMQQTDTRAFSDDYGEEMADIAIRMMVMIETLWPDWCVARIQNRRLVRPNPFQIPEVMLWPMIRWARKATEYWRKEQRTDTQQCLELFLLELWRLSDRLNIDLDVHIQVKMTKNSERPILNGKKRTEG